MTQRNWTMVMTFAVFSLSAALLAVTMAHGGVDVLPRATPESVGLSSPRLREATDLLRQFVAERKIAGAVAAIARNGRLAYLDAVGAQDLETRTPMDARSIFRIYSMTKSVTAIRWRSISPHSSVSPYSRRRMVRRGALRGR